MNSVAIAPVYIHSTVKRRKQTWYTIADGNWSNPNIWSSNGRRRYSYPGQATPVPIMPASGDDVYIGHAVTLNVANIIANNVAVAGSLTFDSTARTFSVNGDLQATGSVDMSNAAHFLVLYGVNNYITTFTSGTLGTVTYWRKGDQPIMNLSYRNLTATSFGTKYISADLSVAGNLTVTGDGASGAPTFELSAYNLSVTGTTSIAGQVLTNGNYNAVLSKTGSGTILFVGLVTMSTLGGILFSGNPTVEFRGGFTSTASAITNFNTGTSLWSITTNTQTFTLGTATYPFTCPISIVGAITLNEAGTGIMQLNQPIDCTSQVALW
jgi:hypothetical protein